MRYRGTYFTWTNKTVWSRIDKVFVNTYWFDQFGFSQVTCMANSLSNHTSMVIDFTGCPKLNRTFQFCDMWVRD